MNTYEKLISEMPIGLDRSILRVLSSHQGKENAIGRGKLVSTIRLLGTPASERQVREEIKNLRRVGHLICSAPGEAGGYYLAMSLGEYQEFKQTELLAKILDMSETVSAMDKAAQRQFGQGYQASLL